MSIEQCACPMYSCKTTLFLLLLLFCPWPLANFGHVYLQSTLAAVTEGVNNDQLMPDFLLSCLDSKLSSPLPDLQSQHSSIWDDDSLLEAVHISL